jgi:IS605 OrfB family transposase
VLGRAVKDVKREAILKFGITARQFNSLKVQLAQVVEAWREGVSFRITDLEDRIKGLGKAIQILEKKIEKERKNKVPSQVKIDRWRFTIHQKSRSLASCRDRLQELLVEIKGIPRICFGGRELLKQDKIAEWQVKRSSQIFLLGSSDETAGNQSCQWDGVDTLLIKLPEALGGERVKLTGVKFAYGQDCLGNRAGKPLTWLLFKDEKGRWHANVTLPETPAPVTNTLSWGGIGVDVNENHLAVGIVDRYGNLTETETLDFPEAGIDTGKAEDILWTSIHRLVQLAKENHCGIVVEDLDFSNKKSYLKMFGKKHAKRLSSFAYAKFFEFLSGICARQGVELVKVNPAYTSQVARAKYVTGYRITVHHAAALVIARRGMNFGERLVCKDSGTLIPAASTDRAKHGCFAPRHVLSRWKGVSRLTREGRVGRTGKHVSSNRLGVGNILPQVRLSRKSRSRVPTARDADCTMSLAGTAA